MSNPYFIEASAAHHRRELAEQAARARLATTGKATPPRPRRHGAPVHWLLPAPGGSTWGAWCRHARQLPRALKTNLLVTRQSR